MSNENNIGSNNPNVGKTPFNVSRIIQDLDAADGQIDGKIEANIWNDYVKEHGGKEIKKFIKLDSAARSIRTNKTAQDLDAADGQVDGKIEASIWNDYAKEHGGKEIKKFIELDNAIRSIGTYNKREEVYGTPDNPIDEISFGMMVEAGKLKPGDVLYVYTVAGCNYRGKITINADGKTWKDEPY